MTWTLISDDFMLDERVQEIDCCALTALLAAYGVCTGEVETDGMFAAQQLHSRWPPTKGSVKRLRRALDRLVEAGLLERLSLDEVEERHRFGAQAGFKMGTKPNRKRHYFQIVDYLDTQQSAEVRRAKRLANRARQQRLRDKRKQERLTALRNAPPIPLPTPEGRSSPPSIPPSAVAPVVSIRDARRSSDDSLARPITVDALHQALRDRLGESVGKTVHPAHRAKVSSYIDFLHEAADATKVQRFLRDEVDGFATLVASGGLEVKTSAFGCFAAALGTWGERRHA